MLQNVLLKKIVYCSILSHAKLCKCHRSNVPSTGQKETNHSVLDQCWLNWLKIKSTPFTRNGNCQLATNKFDILFKSVKNSFSFHTVNKQTTYDIIIEDFINKTYLCIHTIEIYKTTWGIYNTLNSMNIYSRFMHISFLFMLYYGMQF